MKPAMTVLVLALAASALHAAGAPPPPAALPLPNPPHAVHPQAGPAQRVQSPTLTCAPDATHLCLNASRFRVAATWATASGASGSGTAVQLTDDTGYFWFFDSTNVEVILKVLDGCGVNGRFWVFTAGLTNVAVQLTVTDVVTGTMKQYQNPQSSAFQPIQDTSAFAGCDGAPDAAGRSPAASASAPRTPPGTRRSAAGLSAPSTPPSACTPGDGVLCLNGDRFQVSATWTTADGATGSGHAVALTSDTGYFWFFASSNVELIVKVLDGCALDQQYWVFAAGLTNVAVTLQVTDTITGKVRSYTNPQNSTFEPVQDTAALAVCLPSCDSQALTVQQVQNTVASSVAGLADPSGADLHLVLNRFMAAAGCDLAPPASSSHAPAARALAPRATFDPTVQYCGPGNSTDNPWLRLLVVSPELNEACFTHDNCYAAQCNADGCFFVPGLTTSCDEPFFATCNNDIFAALLCPIAADCVVCDIAERTYAIPRSLRPPLCQQAPCNGDPSACDANSGLCGGRVIDSLARAIYNYPLIDSLLPGQFPRGGSYGAQLSGSGLGGATALTTDNLAVSGSVLSSAPSEVAVQLTSTPVPECQTSSAAISGVSLSLLGDWPVPLSAPTVYVVAGPSPQVERFLVTDGTTILPRGSSTQVNFIADILSAGNVQFFYVGCAVCQVDYGPSTGDQFETTLRFTVTVTIPQDWGASTWLVEVGAVDGAGQGGVECSMGSGSPATMLIDVDGSPPGPPAAAVQSPAITRWTLPRSRAYDRSGARSLPLTITFSRP